MGGGTGGPPSYHGSPSPRGFGSGRNGIMLGATFRAPEPPQVAPLRANRRNAASNLLANADTIIGSTIESNRWFADMPSRLLRHLRSPLRPGLWLAALVAAAMLVSGGNAQAAAVSAAPLVEADHGEHCDCGVRCREAACCCGPTDEPAWPWRAFEPLTEEDEANSAPVLPKSSGPCLGALPCGDPAAPVEAASVPGKSAALSLRVGNAAGASRRLLIHPASLHAPDRRPERLEKPPR